MSCAIDESAVGSFAVLTYDSVLTRDIGVCRPSCSGLKAILSLERSDELSDLALSVMGENSRGIGERFDGEGGELWLLRFRPNVWLLYDENSAGDTIPVSMYSPIS